MGRLCMNMPIFSSLGPWHPKIHLYKRKGVSFFSLFSLLQTLGTSFVPYSQGNSFINSQFLKLLSFLVCSHSIFMYKTVLSSSSNQNTSKSSSHTSNIGESDDKRRRSRLADLSVGWSTATVLVDWLVLWQFEQDNIFSPWWSKNTYAPMMGKIPPRRGWGYLHYYTLDMRISYWI